ncbi:membrane protein [Streptomyces caelestis]|uniref:Membrane protein n=1 Tax=Streptomyces caelestis TaxID=36816 RepID=A0A0M8QWH8_9ACTN|nr:membrane protein [Streptomyces caelestis]KOV22157.1 membrane protein [Streptomyces sp. XY152]
MTAALFLLLAPGLAACGGDGGGGYGSSPTPSADGTTSAPASAPADPGAAEREIRQNWEKFFDPATPVDEKKKLLQNGEMLGPVLEAFSGDDRAGQVRAKVTDVAFTSPTEADVTFTLTLRGATALPDASGTSVDDDGTWKVSVKSLCALVRLSGDESPPDIPGC